MLQAKYSWRNRRVVDAVKNPKTSEATVSTVGEGRGGRSNIARIQDAAEQFPLVDGVHFKLAIESLWVMDKNRGRFPDNFR